MQFGTVKGVVSLCGLLVNDPPGNRREVLACTIGALVSHKIMSQCPKMSQLVS